MPLSTQDKVTQCESFLERARKREAAARELVLQAQTELTRLSAEVVEGEERLATLRAELERPQPPVIAVDMSAEVERFRVLVEQLSKEKEDGRPQIGPPKRACRREDFVPHCDEEMQEWTEGRQKDLQAAVMARQAPRSGEGLPTLVQSSAGVTTCYPRTVVSDAVCSGEHGEVIRVRCGMAGARVGEAAKQGPGRESRRRRRIISSDEAGVDVSARATEVDSDDAPLVSPTVASVSVVDALECDLSATQWEPSASFSVRTRGPEFLSGTACTPLSLSNRFSASDDCPGPEVHVMSEGVCESTA